MTTICLNMIVKNEEKIIERMLNSVVRILDFFIIIDTGSTDRTIEIIQDFFSNHNISGFIKKSQFRNFQYNRNEGLKLSNELAPTDYLLLLDADMVLECNNFSKSELMKDMYYILQKNDSYTYKNIRIIKNKDNFVYKGLTHEVIMSTETVTSETFPKNSIFINDIGDGGCKNDKIERDIKLLIRSIKEDPDNSRNYFYLANTYFTKKDFEKSEKCYLKRIILGGWKEELWYSYYRLGLIYLLKRNSYKSIFFFMEAYEYSPNRLENIYYLMNFYRINYKRVLFLHFYNLAKDILDKNIDRKNFLFLENDIYEKKIPEEYKLFKELL